MAQRGRRGARGRGGRVPRVSVVVPTRNRAAMLRRALASVLAQDHDDLEVVVVDDRSTDATPAVVAAIGDPRVRYVREPRRRGQAGARNRGIRCARGCYVAFLDDDDEWLPGALAARVDALDRAPPGTDLAYGWRHVVGPDGRVLRSDRRTLDGPLREPALALRMPGPPSVWLVRAAAVRAVGGFDESLPLAVDLDFVVRLALAGSAARCVRRFVAIQHRHGKGQLTDRTPAQLAARVDFVRGHIARHAAELRPRPAAWAGAYLRLARYEALLGERRRAVATLATACRRAPAHAALFLLGRVLERSAIRIPERSVAGPPVVEGQGAKRVRCPSGRDRHRRTTGEGAMR